MAISSRKLHASSLNIQESGKLVHGRLDVAYGLFIVRHHGTVILNASSELGFDLFE